ncbi:MAG: DNA polymerase III subunit alpha [Gammaproteobacteria bacterium]|nr:MAG: DNA polymerase III subunit alpha [Gammaproteobacteria bacterium]
MSLPATQCERESCEAALPQYAELHCLSNFTFLRGASHPHELVEQADSLGYAALAITDECSVAGVVRAHMAAQDRRLRLIIGSEFRLVCGLKLVALAIDRRGYGRLCRLITRGRRAAGKGHYSITRAELEAAGLEQCFILWLPAARPSPQELRWLAGRFPGRVRIAVELLREGSDRERLAALAQIGAQCGVPLLASGDVHMHVRARRRLQDALTAIRLKVPIAHAGLRLYANGERYLRERARLARLYPRELLEAAVELALQCSFSLDELRYEYPRELVPPGQTPASYLRRLTYEGARWRWPDGVPPGERAAIEHELALIAELRYEPYFLTVQDIVAYARRQGILCQGRGSAANSRVCYCLGVTSVDPQRGAALLFERFISRERNEPPDIDIDFEHERREEVLQYVYRKYGRERAALAATVIMYRPRSALRDLAKAFGLGAADSSRLARVMQWWDGSAAIAPRVRDAGFDPSSPWLARLLPLASELVAFPGFPRHLSQHVGGFVISEGLLEELVPIENAAMPERTVVQWDKDDLNDLKLLKVDLLALGMLTALKRAFTLVNDYRGTRHALGQLPAEDPKVYDMISRADTIGVFQIESRAQMSMLPRLKPRCYDDLVIEVAIVRPGPIQGDMVHPYLRRRCGAEPVEYPSEEVREVLQRTLGVPIFQEQVMKIAIVAAGFSPGEADALRRAMGAWKRTGGLDPFRERLLEGMHANGYPQEFAQRIYQQMLGFGEYGFPLSHAASFALLVYDSAWLKCYEPAAFTCALLNSQPMGFYAPAQLVRDARAHGVEVRAVDACVSEWDATLERRGDGEPALRLGMRLVKSLSQAGVMRLLAARTQRPFASVSDLATRAALDRGDLEALAAAGALACLSGNRHLAFWEVAARERPMPLQFAPARRADLEEGRPLLAAPSEAEGIAADYASLGLTLGRHPLALLRERLAAAALLPASELTGARNGAAVRTAGIVLMRQRPATASGVTFLTLEDESGQVNVIVWERVGRAQRRALIESRLLEVHGELQRQDGVTHLIARRLIDRSALLGELLTRSRDFH